MPEAIEAYVQSIILKKTLASLSFDQRGQEINGSDGTEATTIEANV